MISSTSSLDNALSGQRALSLGLLMTAYSPERQQGDAAPSIPITVAPFSAAPLAAATPATPRPTTITSASTSSYTSASLISGSAPSQSSPEAPAALPASADMVTASPFACAIQLAAAFFTALDVTVAPETASTSALCASRIAFESGSGVAVPIPSVSPEASIFTSVMLFSSNVIVTVISLSRPFSTAV